MKRINGADLLVSFLKDKGVKTIFSISGAGNLAILDAIVRDGMIQVIFSHHEQAAIMQAQGYARASGLPGVAIVTTGGGVANSVTGILSAFMDSIPVFIISGNESSFHIESSAGMRAIGVQGFDSKKVMKTMTKASFGVSSLNTLRPLLNKLWFEMNSDRHGPVFLDFPMDLQRTGFDSNLDGDQDNYQHVREKPILDQTKVFNLIGELESASFPLLYIGNGCRNKKSLDQLMQLIRKFDIPYALTWSAIDLYPDKDPLNIGRLGIYGDRAANILLQRADLVLTIGTRLAIPQVGYSKEDFGRKANKWVIEIDPSECNKFPEKNWNIINACAEDFLDFLTNNYVNTHAKRRRQEWRDTLNRVWKALPRIEQIGSKADLGKSTVHSADVIEFLNQNLERDATVVTDVGAGLLTGHYMLSPTLHRVFTSQGLGEMGFGLPGAIGAYFGNPSSQIICLNTDGGIMFNLQELQLISHHKIPLKLFIFNNFGYSMIKASQDNLFGSRQFGSGPESGISFPKFMEIAQAFKMEYLKIERCGDLNEKLREVLASDEATLIEIVMSPNQKYLPRLGTKKNLDGSLTSPPLEDMEPLIPIEQLQDLLGYQPTNSSFEARR